MNSEQVTAFLQEHWYIASVLIGAVILIGAIRNWNWLCNPTGTRDAHRHSRGYRRVAVCLFFKNPSPRRGPPSRMAVFVLQKKTLVLPNPRLMIQSFECFAAT